MAMRACVAFAELALQELGGEHVASLVGDHLARCEAGDDFRHAVLLDARPHFADAVELGRIGIEIVLVANEDHVATTFPVHRLAGHDNRLGLVTQHDAARAKGVSPQPPVDIGPVSYTHLTLPTIY